MFYVENYEIYVLVKKKLVVKIRLLFIFYLKIVKDKETK